jgi:hypothetical protein
LTWASVAAISPSPCLAGGGPVGRRRVKRPGQGVRRGLQDLSGGGRPERRTARGVADLPLVADCTPRLGAGMAVPDLDPMFRNAEITVVDSAYTERCGSYDCPDPPHKSDPPRS